MTRLDRVGVGAAVASSLAALVVYLMTMARTITWMHNGADSGDLVTAAFTFGVPHPPGYPLFTLFAVPASRIPFVEPVVGIGLFTALAAAAAVFVLARTGAVMLRPLSDALPLALIPPAAVLILAFAPALWAQAIIPEVYTLNLLFVAVVLWSCLTTHPRRIYVAALAFGLGMAHHLSILLLAPGAWVALSPKRKDARALWFLLLPLVLYLYLPLAALNNPPVNWGDPKTLEGFVWLVTAAAYRPYLFGMGIGDALGRAAFAARLLFEQFTLIGAALAVWGMVALAQARFQQWAALVVMFVPVVLYAILYASRDSFIYLLPALAIALMWLIYGAGDVAVSLAGDQRNTRTGAEVGSAALGGDSRRAHLSWILVAALLSLAVYNLITHWSVMDASRDRTAFDYAKGIIEPLPQDAVIFADGDQALFALWYYRHVYAPANARSVIVSQGLLQYPWYYENSRRAMGEAKFKASDELADARARAVEIIRITFGEGRAVCFTDSSPLLEEFEYEERGAVKCVAAQK